MAREEAARGVLLERRPRANSGAGMLRTMLFCASVAASRLREAARCRCAPRSADEPAGEGRDFDFPAPGRAVDAPR